MSRIFIVLCTVLFFSDVLCRHFYFENSIHEDILNIEREDNRICGYKSCHRISSDKLNVHIVPHSHDDVGWLKTVDQYYYGSETLIQKAGVQYIIDSVVQELLKDARKRFIYVESAFFFQWWKEQEADLQEKVKQLVNEGRLEFIGGAWSMNDEATTHYQSIVDQFSWGLRKINDTFGKCGRPKIGWQIDPFGHSREMASMFAHMGYDGLFFGRIDYEDKRERLIAKEMEMIWRASASQDESSNIFTGILYNQYQPPPGFCFDILCADEPIIDDKRSPDYNVQRRISEFLNFIDKQRKYFKTNNIILTMGGDFTYMDANVYFKNLDKLIRYANERQINGSDVNLIYSTPSCYLKALHETTENWPIKSDDFFPYSSDPHAFWTGYFTSRPNLKRFEREGNHFLQINKQLAALFQRNDNVIEVHLTFMRETMGIMQHHDAVTGTEKQKVAYDYARRLDVAMKACSANSRHILNALVTDDSSLNDALDSETKNYKFEFENCPDLNISRCDISENSYQYTVTVYNPLSRAIFQYIRIPVDNVEYQVMDYRDVPTISQMLPVPTSIENLKYRSSNATNELVFLATEIPPLGYKSYFISRQPNTNGNFKTKVVENSNKIKETVSIGNKYINLTFGDDGLLTSVSANGVSRSISQRFFYYEAAFGDNREFRNRSSGAYIFRPNNTVDLPPRQVIVNVFKGPLVEEVHQVFNEWISQVVRVYKDEAHAEFEWMVGPIPIDDGKGKEVVTLFTSDIKSNGVFFTDSNGREMIRRERNKRNTWSPHILENVAGNYYPITTKISIGDNEARMALLVDRAQGGSSLEDGAIEIMVHRRLLYDDAFGVEEALNETAFGSGLIARGKHYLMIGASKGIHPSMNAKERFLQIQKLLPPWLFFSNVEAYSYDDWRTNFSNIRTGLSQSLPQNINLMTLEPWRKNELLIRFEHILEKDEDDYFSKTVSFNIADTLSSLKIVKVRETTLDGNMWLEDAHRLQFIPETENESRKFISEDDYNDSDLDVIQTASKPLVDTKYIPEVISVERNRRKKFIKKNKDGIQGWSLSNKLQKMETLPPTESDPFIISLSPMQIRTFVVILEQQI